jgi:hypothetical protein
MTTSIPLQAAQKTGPRVVGGDGTGQESSNLTMATIPRSRRAAIHQSVFAPVVRMATEAERLVGWKLTPSPVEWDSAGRAFSIQRFGPEDEFEVLEDFGSAIGFCYIDPNQKPVSQLEYNRCLSGTLGCDWNPGRRTRRYWRRRPLSGFIARIQHQTQRHTCGQSELWLSLLVEVVCTGAERETEYLVLELSAGEFAEMRWPERYLGRGGIVYRNRGLLRAAIQVYSIEFDTQLAAALEEGLLP